MESMEIQLARLDERMKMMLDRMEDNQKSHSYTREWMKKTDITLHDINARTFNVENTLAKAAPTIDEFVEIKHKVIGAGMAGRWVWGTLGIVLGFIISTREHFVKFFTGQA